MRSAPWGRSNHGLPIALKRTASVGPGRSDHIDRPGAVTYEDMPGVISPRGVQFVTFPETVVHYYPYFSFVQPPVQNIAGPEQRKLLEQAVTVPSPATDAIGEAARQAGVVVRRVAAGGAGGTERPPDATGMLSRAGRGGVPWHWQSAPPALSSDG